MEEELEHLQPEVSSITGSGAGDRHTTTAKQARTHTPPPQTQNNTTIVVTNVWMCTTRTTPDYKKNKPNLFTNLCTFLFTEGEQQETNEGFCRRSVDKLHG